MSAEFQMHTLANLANLAKQALDSSDSRLATPTPATCWRWLVVLPDGTRWEVDTLPHATLEEMRERFPGAHLEMLEVAP